MKRLLHDPPIDVAYIHDTFMPSHTPSQSELGDCLHQLETHVAEFETFMHDVECGAIAVRQGLKSDWSSYVSKRDGWISATYAGKLGPVIDYQKHEHKHPYTMIYAFTFSGSGYLKRAELYRERFDCDFDGQGRLLQCQKL